MVSWRRLLVALAVGQSGLFLSFGAASRDKESLAFGVVLLCAIGLLRVRRGGLGHAAVTLVAIDVLYWLLPAAIDNVRHDDRFVAILLPSVSVVLALLALVAVCGDVGSRRRSRSTEGRGAVLVAALGVGALLVVTVVAGASGRGNDHELQPGGIRESARNLAFSETRIVAPSGTVTIQLTNHDMFWHTLTIPELSVDLNVPVGGARTASFHASPGTYTFYCAIPGHRSAGMKGTLVVTAP